MRQERSVTPPDGYFVSGESDEGRMFSKFSGVAFDNRDWQQTAVHIHDARIQEHCEFGLLQFFKDSLEFNSKPNAGPVNPGVG